MKKRKVLVAIVFLVLLVTACTPMLPQYSVSGTVTDENGVGIPDVTLTFSNDFGSVVTDANGNWKKDLLKGQVTITPLKEDWFFDPESKLVSQAATDICFIGSRDEHPDIQVSLWLQPSYKYSVDCPEYFVTGLIRRTTGNTGNAEFTDAIIIVNNVQLQPEISGTNYYFRGIVELKSGDIVNASISHSAFQTIEKTLVVPPSLNSFTTDPADVNKWVTGEIEEITLSWDQLDCDGYECDIWLYDEAEEPMGGYGILTNDTNIVIGQSRLSMDDQKASFVTLVVYSRNYIPLKNFGNYSIIEIQSPNTPSISTLPDATPNTVPSKPQPRIHLEQEWDCKLFSFFQ